jgi:2-methylisocitrate lyase-like PEP mutase family enzyme
MTVTPEKPGAQLRRMLAEPGMIRAINIYDPLSARIAESLGFKMIALGAGISALSSASPSRRSR